MFNFVMKSVIWVLLITPAATGGILLSRGHLHCYECQTLTEGEKCNKIDTNHTPIAQCPNGYQFCMAKRLSYTTNGTNFRLWHMARNCSSSCKEYCIMMGERNKIVECTSCCTKDLCNTGSGASANFYSTWNVPLFIIDVILCFVLKG